MPSHAVMALCCIYANRYHNLKRLERASRLLHIPFKLKLHDSREDRRLGLRLVTFISKPKRVKSSGIQVASALLVFRGTRINKSANLRADLQLLRNADTHLVFVQKALAMVLKAMHALEAEHPDVRWVFQLSGHSLGGFMAICATILCPRVRHCVTFECPGVTTFYHAMAAEAGDEAHWAGRVTNYLAMPNPINMCHQHLGRVLRVHTKVHCKIDALYVFRCLFGTLVRGLNWLLLANVVLTLLRLVLGLSRSVLCGGTLAATQGVLEIFQLATATECGVELAVCPSHVISSAYWTLRSAGASIAGQLGSTFTHVLQQHSMWAMARAFDGATGQPRRCTEMASWPRMGRVTGSFGSHLGRVLRESFVSSASTEGITVLFHRDAMIEARVRSLPGYLEAGDADLVWDDQPFFQADIREAHTAPKRHRPATPAATSSLSAPHFTHQKPDPSHQHSSSAHKSADGIKRRQLRVEARSRSAEKLTWNSRSSSPCRGARGELAAVSESSKVHMHCGEAAAAGGFVRGRRAASFDARCRTGAAGRWGAQPCSTRHCEDGGRVRGRSPEAVHPSQKEKRGKRRRLFGGRAGRAAGAISQTGAAKMGGPFDVAHVWGSFIRGRQKQHDSGQLNQIPVKVRQTVFHVRE